MSRQIKAIQCPKCGSTSKTEIKQGFFKCANCGTEYYLDDDEIVVNQNIHYNHNPVSANPAFSRKKLILIMLAVFIFLAIALPYFFVSSNTVSHDLTAIKETPEAVEIRWSNDELAFFLDKSGKPIIAKIGTRQAGDSAAEPAILFTDPLSQKELGLHFMTLSIADANSVSVKRLPNGEVYIIFNRQKIYKIERDILSATDVTNTLFSAYPQMSTGIASVVFIEAGKGEGLKILTNDDNVYYYYPVVGKFFTFKENEHEIYEMDYPKPGGKIDTVFQFSTLSNKYPDEIIQLIRYIKKDNTNGPDFIPWLSWNSDYLGGGVYSPKSIVYRTNTVLIRWKDFTPGRKYYDPNVIYFDKDFVLITIRNTPAPDAKISLQCLDANTADIKWTLPLERGLSNELIRYNGGFIVTTYNTILAIDNNGKVVSTIKKE